MSQKARNADYTKEYNRKTVLRILRRNTMSRSELARATGLTRASTSLIVEDLLREGFLTELAPQSVGRGRSAIPLSVSRDSFYALGVDIARRGCSVGLSDMTGTLLQYRKVADEADLIGSIVRELENLFKTVDKEKVVGIGISAPGPLDHERGQILAPFHFERWHGVEICRLLSEPFGIPAYLEHDVCAMAMRELERGESQNFMLLFVDSGIGAAIVSGGKLLGGSRYFTGELGHTTIRFDGRLCECGNRGCLEGYASLPNILEGSSFASWKELIDHLDEDEEARKLLDQEATYLAAGVINLLNLIPVDTIYLAGDICYHYEHLARRLQREVGTRALDRRNNSIHIFPADQQVGCGVLAASDIVFSRLLTV